MRSQLRALSDAYTECEGELTRWKGEVVRLALQLMARERDTSHDSIKYRESIMNAESARAMAERRAVDSDSRRIQAESRCTALEEEVLTLRRQTQSSFISLQIEKSNYSRQIAETRSELELYRFVRWIEFSLRIIIISYSLSFLHGSNSTSIYNLGSTSQESLIF